MAKVYVFYDKVVGGCDRIPQRFKRLCDAKMALRMYRDKHPITGERYTLARLVDVVGRFQVDKVYNW